MLLMQLYAGQLQVLHEKSRDKMINIKYFFIKRIKILYLK